jgi:hypothetical protein
MLMVMTRNGERRLLCNQGTTVLMGILGVREVEVTVLGDKGPGCRFSGSPERIDRAAKCFTSVGLFAAGQRTSVSFFGERAYFIENFHATNWHFGCVGKQIPCVCGDSSRPASVGT